MSYFDNYEGRIQAETMEITVALICQHSSNNSNYKRIKEQVEHLIHRHEILFTGMHRKLDSLSIKINKNEKNRQDIIDDLLCHDLTIIFNHLIQNNNISWGKIITILAFSTFIARKHNDISDNIRLAITLFHNGRRFFQKKIPLTLNSSTSIDYEIKDTITENIPQNDIHSIYVHVEFNSKDNSFISSSSILLGEHTLYESDWHKMLEYPRQIHHRWYPFLG
ncbi:unnamed protein product [Rotaria sp. Silwood1]|nr:unnamed protein product [Rotaria sp. Silwood1]